jgi:hypothetical protein
MLVADEVGQNFFNGLAAGAAHDVAEVEEVHVLALRYWAQLSHEI